MSNTIRIGVKADAAGGEKAGFVLHPHSARAAGITAGREYSVGFGSQKCFLAAGEDSGIPRDVMLFSPRALSALHLPDYVPLELRAGNGEITLGPCIGLLLRKQDSRLKPSFLKKLAVYVDSYDTLHGAVIVFALDKVDTSKRLIEGYCYRPADGGWQRGVFPYPAAFYRTVGLSGEWKDHFLSVIGKKFFNSHYFSKWKMAQWLSADPRVGPHIPLTRLCSAPQDVFDMLETHKTVYIKPVLGLRGHGVVKTTHENGAIVFRTRREGLNVTESFADQSAAGAYIQKQFGAGRFLVQQGVDLVTVYGRLCDFRCIMQKDIAQRWVCQSVICRIGATGSIVSNISSGGNALRASELPENALPFRGGPLFLERRIRSFAMTVCGALDECGILCGSLGLDIAADREGKLWLIEINNRDPDPSIAMDIQNARLYRRLKTTPLFYLKALAGFGAGTEEVRSAGTALPPE